MLTHLLTLILRLVGKPKTTNTLTAFSWHMMVLAIPLGLVVGLLVVAFLEIVSWGNILLFNLHESDLTLDEGGSNTLLILLMPTSIGLIIGLIKWKLLAGKRIHALGDVIYYVIKHKAQLPAKCGFWSTCASILSLAGGASAGAESPVVHLGAWFSSAAGRIFHIPQNEQRVLIGAAVAAAIACAFNAPIGGAFFALEVVLGYFSFAVFAPIIMASVAGTVVTRQLRGDISTFSLPEYELVSLYELPAFIILGVLCAVVAFSIGRSIELTQQAFQKLPITIWMKPAIGGLLVGIIGTTFPHVLGVGTNMTEFFLSNSIPLTLLFVFAIAKTCATAITIGSGMSAGTIGPALMIGALTGSVFGTMAASILPSLASSHNAYAIVAMSATVSAIVGGPISTMIIISELTADTNLTLAVMVASVISSHCISRFWFSSYFAMVIYHTRNKLNLSGDREHDIVHTATIAGLVHTSTSHIDIQNELYVMHNENLASALNKFTTSRAMQLLVQNQSGKIIGYLNFHEVSEYYRSIIQEQHTTSEHKTKHHILRK